MNNLTEEQKEIQDKANIYFNDLLQIRSLKRDAPEFEAKLKEFFEKYPNGRMNFENN